MTQNKSKAVPTSIRDHLPGISKKFNPQEAITVYKEVIDAENEHMECPRDRFSGCEQFELRSEDATIPCLKHASYWTIVAVGETPLSAVSSRAVQARVRSHGPVGTQVSSTGDQERDEYLTAKKEWDDRYRFFSRPFNLSNHACGAFESLRMRNCFDRSFSGDPLLTPQQLPVYRGRSMEKRLASCSELVELSRKRSAEKGSHTSGYKWPKYKFFSSGLQTPSSGLVDKFYRSA